MKTIYTDTYGLLPWAWLLVGAWWLFSALVRSTGWWAVMDGAAGLIGVALAFHFFRQRLLARREGRDPSIIKVKNVPDQ